MEDEDESSSLSSTVDEDGDDCHGATSRNRQRTKATGHGTLGEVVDAHDNIDENDNQDPEREWTDAKHSLYLRSMEDEFVRQLYESKRSRQQPASKDEITLVTVRSSGETSCIGETRCAAEEKMTTVEGKVENADAAKCEQSRSKRCFFAK